ncbi:Phenazine-specific methyltransferase PhzM [Balamuthia mandrillaris]
MGCTSGFAKRRWGLYWLGVAMAVVGIAWMALQHGNEGGSVTLSEPRPLPPLWVMRVLSAFVHGLDGLRALLLPPELFLAEITAAMGRNQALFAAAKLGIADVIPLGLESGQRWPTAEEIADRIGAKDGDSVYRLLRYMASFGVFVQHEGRRFSHNKFSVFLREDHPDSPKAMAMAYGDEQFKGWTGLPEQIITGNTAFKSVYGAEMWEWMAQPDNSANLENFNRMFTTISKKTNPPLLSDFDWTSLFPSSASNNEKDGNVTFVDVGGGLGNVLEMLLKAFPHASGILFDQPHVIEQAKHEPRWSSSSSLANRSRLVGGSFLEEGSIPSEGDIYILRMIIHDWNDHEARLILQNVHKAMHKAANKHKDKRLVIVEHLLPPEGHYSSSIPFSSEFLDMHMMIMMNGKERTEKQFEELFRSASFELASVHPTRSYMHVIVAVPSS